MELTVGLRLFVRVNGKYKEVSALSIGQNVKPVLRINVITAVNKYLENCTSLKCKKNQYNEKLYFQIFIEFLKSNEISVMDDIKRIHLDEFELLLLKSMKVSSVIRRFNTFKNFFSKCIEWGFIHTNPSLGMKKRREENNPFLPWSREVFKEFIKSTIGQHKNLFLFLWLTGCRPAEANNLKWTDIHHDKKELVFRCGKNAKISRDFPISKEISKLLHSMRIDSLHVFSFDKKLLSNQCLSHYCKKRLRRLGYEKYTVYGLRHAFGTRLAEAGVNAFDIAYLMGHKNIKTTQRYIHREKKRLISALDSVS